MLPTLGSLHLLTRNSLQKQQCQFTRDRADSSINMSARIFISTLLLHSCVVFLCRADDIDGYYWRDFKGEIPNDAVPGGKNALGHTTFIGQILHDKLLIPARIDEKVTYYEWGYREYIAEQNIKILCSPHPEDFEWIKTANRDINTVRNKTFVVAGYEPGITSLVGRKEIDNELVVGKVVFTVTQSTLNTTKDGVGTQHGEFEVLCYTPKSGKGTKRKNTSGRPVVINFYY